MKNFWCRSAAVFFLLLLKTPAFAVPFSSSPPYEAAMQRAEKEYLVARKLCDTLDGHAQDVCIAEAKAERKRQEADAEAAEKDTPEAKTKALISYADAALEVAETKCAVQTGNDKDICIKRARLEHQQSVSLAKANQKVREAQQEALEEISEADYQLALEKCESVSGKARENCRDNVKTKFER